MNIENGLILKHFVEDLQKQIIDNGNPILVKNQGTIELTNFNCNLNYSDFIDLNSIQKYMDLYYIEHDINLSEIKELETEEYTKISNELIEKFELFEDIRSRQVIFTDDCCISLIHFLIRDNKIICNIHLRSSDVVNKLFLDLFIIHQIILKLQEKLDLKNVRINLNISSAHIIVNNF